MKIVVDASSWIDYFEGRNTGEKVKSYIENIGNEIITNVLNLAEISSLFTRKGFDLEEALKIIFSNSKTYYFDRDFSKEAGILHAEIRKEIKDFGLADAFVLLTARKLNAKILTGDNHFRNFKETILINED